MSDKIYILRKDGKEVKRFTSENISLKWLQDNCPHSWDYAFTHGGYTLEKRALNRARN